MYFCIHWERERSMELTRDMVSNRFVKTFSWFCRVSHVHRTLNPDFVSLLGANSLFWECHDKSRGLFHLLVLKWWACSQVKIYLLPWGKCLTNIAILNNDHWDNGLILILIYWHMVSLEKDVTLLCHESRTEKKLPVTTYDRIKYIVL